MLKRVIDKLAKLFLGRAYSQGFMDEKNERIVYEFESIYPDLETMVNIENKVQNKLKNTSAVSIQ